MSEDLLSPQKAFLRELAEKNRRIAHLRAAGTPEVGLFYVI
jgi:hypothetical protein